MPGFSRFFTAARYRFSSREVQYVVLGIGIVVVGIYFRVDGLGTIPTWFDEETTAEHLRGPIGLIWQAPENFLSSPLLYNALIWAVQLIDTGAFALRLPSAIASIATIIVLLALPRVGVPPVVALASATMLSVSLTQVRYAQEVREYAISTLVVALALYFALGIVQSIGGKTAPGRRYWVAFGAVAVLSPTLSYGSIFAIVSLFGVLLLIILLNQPKANAHFASWIVSFSAFIVAAAVIFWSYARRQFGITTWSHLEAFYPDLESGALSWLSWTAKSTLTYLLFLVHDKSVVAIFLVSALALTLTAVFSRRNEVRGKLENRAFILTVMTSALLVAGSILTATLQLYPFGPNRQQLFAAPLIVVSGVFLTYVLAIRTKRHWWIGVVIALFLFAYFQNDMEYHVRPA